MKAHTVFSTLALKDETMRTKELNNLIQWAQDHPRQWWVLTQSRRFKAVGSMINEVMRNGEMSKRRSHTLWRLADVMESERRWEDSMVTLPARGTMVAENVTITGCRKDDTGNVKVVFFSMKGWKGEFNLLRSGDINLVRDRWTDLFTVRGKVLVTNDTYVTLKVEELSPVSGEL